MVKIDLITGFLGSGKTTFIKKYASYFIANGQNIGILENDYGAINVDMMLLQELMSDKCELEMISGGCDKETYRRRFRTKLIAMAMSGYDRVIVEPSGVFDIDEFFDVIHDEPLDKWYEPGNVIAIADASSSDILSAKSAYVLASEISCAGMVVLSHSDKADDDKINKMIENINKLLNDIGCARKIAHNDIKKGILNLTDDDIKDISQCGYKLYSYEKQDIDSCEDVYKSLYFMNKNLDRQQIEKAVSHIFADEKCGNVMRIKGFFKENDKWHEVNATKSDININEINNGQDVIIVIGENPDTDVIDEYISNA